MARNTKQEQESRHTFSGKGIGCAAGVIDPAGVGDSECEFFMRLLLISLFESSEALRFEAEGAC